MKRLKRIVASVGLAVLALMLNTLPALAIANPDNIDFTSSGTDMYMAFHNVYETGDMLFIAESYVHYVSEPTDYTASEAFVFQVLNVAGDEVLLTVPVTDYEDTIISIYQTALQVTAAGLTTATEYKLRITGSPIVFPSLTEGTNMVTATLDEYGDWIDQSEATPTLNPLRNFCINVANNIEASSSTTMVVTVAGVEYINTAGRDIFLAGVPNLDSFVSNLFQTATTPMTADAPDSTGTYASELTPANNLGTTIANGLTNMGVWLGMSQASAGGIILLVGTLFMCIFIYKQTENPIVSLVIGSVLLSMGAFMGLMPLAMLLAVTLIIVVATGFYIWTRGTL